MLDSLVCFPKIGDTLTFEPAKTLSLRVQGPYAGLLGEQSNNLVLAAARLLAEDSRGARLTLLKRLPVASGIGGGSADAAAALRLLSRVWSVCLPSPHICTVLGADVPVCLASRPARMRGIGERLDALALPPFWLVLVNPGQPVSTAAAFAALTRCDYPALPDPPAFLRSLDLAQWLAIATRNDLEDAAVAIEPTIAVVLADLRRSPGCRLARMSGSGATCFGIFDAADSATEAAQRIRRSRRTWWAVAAECRPEGPLSTV